MQNYTDLDTDKIEWTPDLSIGVEALDNDHRRLFRYVRGFVEAIDAGEGVLVSDIYFQALMDYVKYHFSREEAVMAASDHPQREDHMALHVDLAKKVSEIRSNLLLYPDESYYSTVRGFLISWLFEHIKSDDIALGKHLVGHEAVIAKTLEELSNEPDISFSAGPLKGIVD